MRYVLLLLILPFFANSQKPLPCPPPASSKAKSLFEKAVSARKTGKKYEQVKELAFKAVEEDTAYADAWKLIGDMAYNMRDYKVMKEAYTKLIAACPDASPESHFRLGSYLYDTKKYAEFEKYLKSFLDFGSQAKEDQIKRAELLLVRAKLMANPVSFNPVVVKEISTSDPEYLAVISADNEQCFFTRRFEITSKSALTPISVEKFMTAKRKADGNFERGEPMPPPFNSRNSNNEGGPSVTIDNLVIYFTVNQGGNFDICYSEWKKDAWGPITNLGYEVNDPKQWDSQPSISSDGKTLYFASFRDSVTMTSDIYVTRKTNGKWSKAKPLSSMINTNGNEKTPFIHPDGKSLYFSSDSLPGMGGFDIFVSRMDDKGNWSKPVNLGYPINTEGDEVGFFVSTDGRTGYFASNTVITGKGYDIYSFDIPEQVKPEKVLMVTGTLMDEEKEVPKAAKIELKNITTNDITNLEYDTLTGRYASVVPFKDDYMLTVKKDNAAFASSYFSKEDSVNFAPVKVNFELKKIELGVSYTLPDILFATDSYELSLGSKRVIAEFKEFLDKNPKLHIAINGHTDNSGTAEKNLVLSQQRAKAVYNFLISLGISPSRLTSQGFGQSKPVDSNLTAEGRAKNRRTEFVITAK
ncbi:MAG: PD40 domain-containing protein [Bacteroidia bacterium]|nr:PD40 domain-containing protein [Bacteroidia bacterium]